MLILAQWRRQKLLSWWWNQQKSTEASLLFPIQIDYSVDQAISLVNLYHSCSSTSIFDAFSFVTRPERKYWNHCNWNFYKQPSLDGLNKSPLCGCEGWRVSTFSTGTRYPITGTPYSKNSHPHIISSLQDLYESCLRSVRVTEKNINAKCSSNHTKKIGNLRHQLLFDSVHRITQSFIVVRNSSRKRLLRKPWYRHDPLPLMCCNLSINTAAVAVMKHRHTNSYQSFKSPRKITRWVESASLRGLKS